jgi:PAS domain S-box-containing protein
MLRKNQLKTGMPRPRPKSSVVIAYAICPIMLVISVYGFWEWFKIPTEAHAFQLEELFYLMCMAIMPLVMFLFLSVTAAQRLEYNRLSSSYQARVDQLQKRLNHQEDFLHTITDNDPEAVAIFDRQNNYWFINRATATLLGVDDKDVIGKPPLKFVGYDRASKLEARLNDVREKSQPLEILHQVDGDDGKVKFYQAHYEPLKPFGDFSGGVMVRAQDVTTLVVEREKRESMLRQVIGTLVAVVDRRDPYASGHSARVGQLARAIAEEMMLREDEIEASEIAGSLMNFGKVLVPREILTKTTALTPEELQRVRDSIMTSADILSIINFVGPVVPTLKQVQERFDGTGVPNHLKGDQILMTARIVMVANAYVALVSPRAHRPSMDFKAAVQNMLDQADKIFDRRVVLGLANYIQNRPNKLDWLKVAKPS